MLIRAPNDSETSDKKLAADIAASKKELAAHDPLRRHGKAHTESLGASLDPVRQSLAALKEELAQLKKRKSADSKSMKKTNEKARASTKSLIDGMAADVKKTIEDMEARNAATLAELKKVQAEVVELRKSAASPQPAATLGARMRSLKETAI